MVLIDAIHDVSEIGGVVYLITGSDTELARHAMPKPVFLELVDRCITLLTEQREAKVVPIDTARRRRRS